MFKMGGFKSEACEIQCKLCLGRIKLLRNKRTASLHQSRKDVANLLATGKQDYARIRVEGVLREQLMLQAYEILELYVELLSVRTQLISKTKEIPRDMVEAISSIIYTSQRIGDLPELVKMCKMFESKYGKQYVQEAGADGAMSEKWNVNGNLIRCLLVEPPEPEAKLQTLSDIAQEHQVEWDAAAAYRDMQRMLPPAAGVPAPSIIGDDDGPPPAGYAPPAFTPGSQSVMGAPPPPQYHAAPQQYATAADAASAAQHAYATAADAASAAQHAASQAQAAADYAAQFAFAHAGVLVPLPPASTTHAATPSPGASLAAPPDVAAAASASSAAPSSAPPSGWLAAPGAPPAPKSPLYTQSAPTGFVARTNETIQAAVGRYC
ncbi:hypothetical protein FOA52_014771 [Chlamydomonas sp. UWO 241]|nr:hypothetical protein FOA52_014771 [Chlamydomonas sp. UWO 241]